MSEIKRRGRPPKDPADCKSRNITMRFTEAMMAQVREAARVSGLSLNGEVERRLAASFGFVSKASIQDAPGTSIDLIRKIVREELACQRAESDLPASWLAPLQHDEPLASDQRYRY